MNDELLSLAERCQRASGSDYVLDAQIDIALKITADEDHSPPFTASLDAAMALVPDGSDYFPHVGKLFNGQWRATCYEQWGGDKHEATAAAPALALCAAALRARASKGQEE